MYVRCVFRCVFRYVGMYVGICMYCMYEVGSVCILMPQFGRAKDAGDRCNQQELANT